MNALSFVQGSRIDLPKTGLGKIVILALLFVALLIPAVRPVGVEASTGPSISAGSYATSMKCYVSGGENICEKKDGGAYKYQMLKVTGKYFTKNGSVKIEISAPGIFVVQLGAAKAGADGTFAYYSSGIQVCSAGLPMSVRAYDHSAKKWSSSVTVIACSF